MSNAPQTIPTNGGSGGSSKDQKANQMKLYIIGGVVLTILAGFLFYFLNSSSAPKKEVEKNQKQVTLNDAEKQKTAQQYSDKNRNSQDSQINQRSMEDQFTQQPPPQPPEEFTVNVNGQQIAYIKDSSGAQHRLDSEMGQKIKNDYARYADQQNLSTQPNAQFQSAQLNSQLQSEINRLNEQLNTQSQALDEKIETSYNEVQDMKNIIEHQNNTIVDLTNNLKMIQPITQTPEQLAQHLFGKNGEKVLKSKNNSIIASSIVGDKAFLTDENGNVSVVRVGDVVGGTSLKVLKIDPVLNEVVVGN